ncbi:GTP cyclohydrolase I FolE [Chitinophagaceae bacterium LB-8]|uniref:GTP cyclohydrolase 1 n=1 Tax=Paraflavisolibacter caeni TaxID=2982496 RepID=A0A9X2XTZ4_9BACT|nr:GTP cyclohydrolase I FolE [Paraflavisolibacter caeni]MCU7549199.1 GTP cyclohydrolase I FolE [Paraflavisolibacter caeni]
MFTINSNGNYVEETNGKFVPPLFNELLGTNDSTLDDEAKMLLISNHFKQIMLILGLDLNDDSLKATPDRVAKMYVKELFSGLNADNKPDVTLFENKYRYNEMLIEKNITVYSCCEHHFVPIIGKAHVAYFSSGKVIGLSKINRIVQYYCKRPQVQERLTEQIAGALKEALQTEDVAVVIDAAHLCVASRGVSDVNSTTITSHYSGKFRKEEPKREFISFIK